MDTNNKNPKKDKKQDQPNNFIEGDQVVPQGGHVDDYDEEPVEEKSDNIGKQTDPPLNPPQKTTKKIPHLRTR